MKTLIITTVIGSIIMLLACLLAGCSMFAGQAGESTITVPPTPGVQLWQAAKKSNWLVTLSILGIAAGVFALVNGSVKLGTASIASGSVSLFMALAVARFSMWMAVCGLIGSVMAALFSIFARRKALIEIIKGVQDFKDGYPEQTDIKQNLNSKLARQSNTTKKIVSDIKGELRLKGAI